VLQSTVILPSGLMNLLVVLPDFGGPIIAILIGTTGRGDGCFKYCNGFAINWSLFEGVDMKYT
jgi:hypothetical protein